MEAIIERAAGLDVHQGSVVACVIVGAAGRRAMPMSPPAITTPHPHGIVLGCSSTATGRIAPIRIMTSTIAVIAAAGATMAVTTTVITTVITMVTTAITAATEVRDRVRGPVVGPCT